MCSDPPEIMSHKKWLLNQKMSTLVKTYINKRLYHEKIPSYFYQNVQHSARLNIVGDGEGYLEHHSSRKLFGSDLEMSESLAR